MLQAGGDRVGGFGEPAPAQPMLEFVDQAHDLHPVGLRAQVAVECVEQRRRLGKGIADRCVGDRCTAGWCTAGWCVTGACVPDQRRCGRRRDDRRCR
ncbi:MAG TPA: hypothetical protein P5163_14640, partial [Rubrivivax sp.]|nr:hypothetical protein [Rubrivivax sp.]